jgi:UDP:flavonoid glycosyltransferase YjiC (YdhE family)
MCLQLSNKGVGESLPLHHLSPDSLVSGVTKVLCDPGYRRRASHLSDSIRGSPGIKQAVGRVLGFAEGEVQT